MSVNLSNLSVTELEELQKQIPTVLAEKGKLDATEEIADLCKQARALISKAEDIAEENAICFSFSVEYGMGGTYRPASWLASDSCSDEWAPSEGEWNASSLSC